MQNVIMATGERIEAKRKHLIERLQSEFEFSEFLYERLDRKNKSNYKKLLNDAEQFLRESLIKSDANIEMIVAEFEKMMQPFSILAKEYTVYCIGHAHIDMNWMWSWPETVAVTNDTFKTVLALLAEYPDFCFSQSQASVYKIIEKYNPDLLEKIKKYIKDGRWELTASHWVENDANIISGEAMCRHLLYTRKYMKDLFGVEPEDIPVNWAPDTFGFAATVPSILRQGAVKYMYLHRPGSLREKKPSAFYWMAPDGAKILVKNDMCMGYNCSIGPHIVTNYLVNFTKETGLKFVNVVYGIGDHGGGPTKQDLNYALEMNQWKIFPNIKFAKVRDFFERLDLEGKALPIIEGELNFEFTGCYTSQSTIKKIARYGEKRLLDTEQESIFAYLISGKKIPPHIMKENWQNILFSHFHDILPGSGVHDTRTYIHGLYQETMASAGIIATEALSAIAENVNTTLDGQDGNEVENILPPSIKPSAFGGGVGYGTGEGGITATYRGEDDVRHFLVFNTSAQSRYEVLEFIIWANSSNRNLRKEKLQNLKFTAISPTGKFIPCQTMETGSYWGHDFVKIVFPVELPPNGYALYSVIEREDNNNNIDGTAFQTGLKHHCFYAFYEKSPEGIENEYIKLELNPNTGWINSLIPKTFGKSILTNKNISLLEYSEERPHRMTAWEVDHSSKFLSPELRSIKRLYDGPYKATLETLFSLKESELKVKYELRAGDPKLYIDLDITWFQRGTMNDGVPRLDFVLPILLKNPSVEYEIPFSGIKREMKYEEEVPALRWAKIHSSSDKYGLLLLNDSKHGHSFKNGILRLSLIRSSYDPDPLPEIGRHQIKLAIMPFDGDLPTSNAIRIGINFNHQPEIISTSTHNGKLPKSLSFIKIDSSSAVLSTIKFSEDSQKKLILRLFNPNARESIAKLSISKQLGALKKISECDILERQIKDISNSLQKKEKAIRLNLKANSIVSYILELD